MVEITRSLFEKYLSENCTIPVQQLSPLFAHHSFYGNTTYYPPPNNNHQQQNKTVIMRYSIVAVALFSGLAFAQSNLPECAQPCIAEAVPAATDCSLDDQACQCEPANKAAIQAAATSCVIAACAEKALEVITAADEACANLPAEGAETSESATPSPTAVETTTAVETSVVETSVVASTYTTSIDTATVEGSATTMEYIPVPTGGMSPNATTSAPGGEFTGAANSVAAGLGSVFAVGLAALAAF
jgi:hypothetical protein